jgi:hypothetical protein
MDVTMVGLQNAGKTSLLRVLAVSIPPPLPLEALADCISFQGGEFTIE